MLVDLTAGRENPSEAVIALNPKTSTLQENPNAHHCAMDDTPTGPGSTYEILECQRKIDTTEGSVSRRSMDGFAKVTHVKDMVKGLEVSLKDHQEAKRAWQTKLYDQKTSHQLHMSRLEAKLTEQEMRQKEMEAQIIELQDSRFALEQQLAAQEAASSPTASDFHAREVEELRRLVEFYKTNSRKVSQQTQESLGTGS
ncbi:hypothetical protein F4804DRAFT_181766 [Jackrogersella minutella]|nr:hypothetical protein F4804DRAFT_181766 [Jackrogersella minutella]